MSVLTSSNPNAPTITVSNPDGSVTVLPGSPLAPYTGYPVLQTQFAKSPFQRKSLDRSILHETDGGAEYSRPMNRNFKRRDYSLGYSLLPDNEMIILRSWQESIGNCAGLFTWVDPLSNEFCLCRLTDTLTEDYAQFSTQPLWNVTFKIRVLRLISTAYAGYISSVPTGPAVSGYYSSATLSQAIITSLSGYFVFINGDLLPAADVTVGSQGTQLNFLNGFTVTAADNLIVFAYPLVTNRLLSTVGTPAGTPDVNGGYAALTLAPALDPTVFYPMLYVNGLLQDSTSITVASNGTDATLTGIVVYVTDKLRVVGVRLPGLCTLTGAVDGINATFATTPNPATYLMVFVGPLLLAPDMYTVTGNSITLHTVPAAGATVRVYTW